MLAAFLCAAASGDLVSVRKDCQAWHKAPEIVHSDMNYKAFIAELTGKLQRVNAAPPPADTAPSSHTAPHVQTDTSCTPTSPAAGVPLCRPTGALG